MWCEKTILERSHRNKRLRPCKRLATHTVTISYNHNALDYNYSSRDSYEKLMCAQHAAAALSKFANRPTDIWHARKESIK